MVIIANQRKSQYFFEQKTATECLTKKNIHAYQRSIMDVVITYVNGLDPEWQRSYRKATRTPIIEKRFRDWGMLKYLMRGIEKNMPFIRKVHLVVSQESQVPEWINRDAVNIVLHHEIIPRRFLPTFNSNTIELHLHNIKKLDEEFIYFNDDMFPVSSSKAEDFFRNGKGVIKFTRHWLALNMFKKICRNSFRLAQKASGMEEGCSFFRPQHICSPMLKSVCKEVYDKVNKEIATSLTPTRTADNYTQYLFLDYMFLNNRIINEEITRNFFSTAIASADSIAHCIRSSKRKIICINDVELSKRRYETLHSAVIEAFEEHFPEKSRYES